MNSDNNINEIGGAAISSYSFHSRRFFKTRICITDHGGTRRREAVNVAELDTNFSESEKGDEDEVKDVSSNFVPEKNDSSDTDTSPDDQNENVQNVAVQSSTSSFAQTSSSSPAQALTSSPALARSHFFSCTIFHSLSCPSFHFFFTSFHHLSCTSSHFLSK